MSCASSICWSLISIPAAAAISTTICPVSMFAGSGVESIVNARPDPVSSSYWATSRSASSRSKSGMPVSSR